MEYKLSKEQIMNFVEIFTENMEKFNNDSLLEIDLLKSRSFRFSDIQSPIHTKKEKIALKLSQQTIYDFKTVYMAYKAIGSIVKTNDVLLYCTKTGTNPLSIITGYQRKLK